MENEGVDNQSMVGSSHSIDPFEGLYSIEEETTEMQSNSLVDNTMVENQVVVMYIVHFMEPKCHEEITFSVAFGFMDGEKENNYTWVLDKLKDMMDPNSLLEVVVTDMELALMNAIARVFSKDTHLLCRWHIDKNVFTKCRRKFDDKTWQQFKHA
ncbi:hypothetical protein Vadar_009520 [Vaccinium darrowii]|uniref:Uncharacterized protein n=1 Tax=Vaccinium darrowii TaxID=229202 RepID=A0ACB7XY19_9ERIC|nr:hypothetical protein Vadar_009520 [Vaccinium darrowii]